MGIALGRMDTDSDHSQGTILGLEPPITGVQLELYYY